MKLSFSLTLIVALAACPKTPGPTEAGSGDAGVGNDAGVVVTDDINAAINRLPKDADGNIPLFTVGKEVVKLGPVIRDPVYARGRCIDLLGACMMGEHLHPMECARKVQTCKTAEPWNEAAPCCPQACVDEAVRREDSGVDRGEAYLSVFNAKQCFPGVLAQYCAAGGKPPGGCPETP